MLFAFLALAGDIGCSIGPTVVGTVSGIFNDNIQFGIIAASFFTIVLIIVIIFNVLIKRTEVAN